MVHKMELLSRIHHLLFAILQLAYIFIASTTSVANALELMASTNNTIDNCYFETTPVSGSNNSTQGVIIQGSSDHECSWQLITGGMTTLIQLVNGSLSGTDYLYLERQGTLNQCTNRYLVFKDSDLPCQVTLSHPELKIHLRGEVTLKIFTTGTGNNSTPCTEQAWQDKSSDVIRDYPPTCTHVYGYNDLISCYLYVRNFTWNYLSDWSYYTKCDAQCPDHCRCTLADREIIYNCPDSSKPLQSRTSFLIFPQNITHLNFSNNKLLSFRSDSLQRIGSGVLRLDLGYNDLVNISAWHYLDNLLELGLTFNKILSIDEDAFEKASNMRELWLYGNNIKTLPTNVFQGLIKLDKLIMWGNGFINLQPGLFDNLTTLTVIDISLSQFTSLPPGLFKDLNSLTYLGLKHGHLVSLGSQVFRRLHSLTSLYVDNNRLLTIEDKAFDSMYKLETLVLSHNKFVTLPGQLFINLTYLRFLDLSFNYLQRVPLIGHLSHLQHLFLNDNDMSKVTLDSFLGIPNTVLVTAQQQEICSCYMPNVQNCSAADKRSEYLTCERVLSDKALAIFTWIFGFAALFGNLLVLLWRNAIHKDGPRVMSLLLSNLALSDMLMGIYMIIIASADVHFGDYFPLNAEAWRTGSVCRIASTIVITSSEASVLFVTLISIDRCVCITFPYSMYKLRSKSTLIVALLVWITAFVMGIIPSILAGHVSTKFYENSHVCIGLPLTQGVTYVTNQQTFNVYLNGMVWYQKTVNVTTTQGQDSGLFYSISIFFGLNALCFLTILASYIAIVHTVYKTGRDAGHQLEMRNQIRLSAKVAAIVATDFFCWFPIIVIGILGRSGVITIQPGVFAWLVTFVLPINSAINPFLYTLATAIASHIHWNKDTKDIRTQNSPLATPVPSPAPSPMPSPMPSLKFKQGAVNLGLKSDNDNKKAVSVLHFITPDIKISQDSAI